MSDTCEFYIANIEPNFESYKQIIDFYHQTKIKSNENININIQTWFNASFCSMLGAVFLMLDQSNEIAIEAEDHVKDIFLRNGFLSHFGYGEKKDPNETVLPYNIFSCDERKKFGLYIIQDFLSNQSFLNVSGSLKKDILKFVFEMFENSKVHGQSDKIIVCGQFFPKKELIQIMIVDLRIGIPECVNRFLKMEMNSIEAIEWAVTDGNTTQKRAGGTGF